jgi:hypothetical protein
MAFTTWTALRTSMLDDLASGSWKTKSYSIGDMTRTFRDFEDFKAMLDYVETRAAAESSTYVGRTYAKNGGSGRW